MNQNAVIKAEILSQALPYIQKYHDKVVVIKYGGNAMINEELKMNVIQDVVLLSEIGIKVILVHGGGPEINQTLKKMNIESQFIHGLRYTDEETMDVDEDFLLSMEHGMPPISGLGFGIDRFVQFIYDLPNIRDTVLFPLMR